MRAVVALRRIGIGAAAVLLLALLWELVKAVVPDEGWSIGELRVLPRTTDLAMPHVTEMIARLTEPLAGAQADPLWLAVLRAGGTSLRIAAVSWLIGVLVGFALALLMTRFALARSAVLPLVVLSQTVPLIALAPLVKGWGAKLDLGSFVWQPWMSVAVIASYLAFFPVAVGALRGLRSPDVLHEELFAGFAASWTQTLVRLRLPASVPHLLPALRLAATSAVLGVVVAEVSTGMPGGIGRMILEFANFASSDPAKPWAPIFGAVLLGLVAAGAVGLIGVGLGRFRRAEVSA